MNPIRFIFEIRFTEPSRRYDFTFGVAKALGHELPHVAGGQAVRIVPKDRRISITVEVARFAINIEEPLKYKEVESLILDNLFRLQSTMQWNKFSRIGYRTSSVKSVNDFEDLVSLSKKKLFQDNSLVSSASDVALPLTLRDENKKINFSYGPMRKEELSRFGFEFQIDSPDAFAYVDLDYFSTEEHGLSSNYVKSFLQSGNKFTNKTLSQFLSILGI